MRFTTILLLLIAPAIGAVGADDLAEQLQALESRWTDSMAAVELPGFSVAVVDKDGVIYSNAFGIRQLDPEKPFTTASSTYIASCTKVYVALAIMQLVDGGAVDLDAPVRTYLPRFELPDAGLAKRITLRDLMCHRYGINAPIAVFHDAYTGMITDDIFYRELTDAEVKGTWSYTNTHFTILGRVIESVTGDSWRDYLAEHVFEPTGMTHTSGYASEVYGYEDAGIPLERFPGGGFTHVGIRKIDNTMHAAGGLGSSADDMARWLQLHLNGGSIDGTRIISEGALAEMMTVHEMPGTSYLRFKRTEMGLGWYLGRYEDELMIHHFGGYAGASAHCSFMPRRGIGVAVLANSSEEGATLIHHVAADIYDVLADRDGTRRWKVFTRQTTKGYERNDAGRLDSEDELEPPMLSLPITAYTKTFTHDRMGALEISADGETLHGTIGNIEFTLAGGDLDAPIARGYSGNVPMAFAIEDGEAVAVTLSRFWGPEPIEFRARP